MSTPKWKAKIFSDGWITEDGKEFSYLWFNDNWSESTNFFLVRSLSVPKTDLYRWELYPVSYKEVIVDGQGYFRYFPGRYLVTRTK